MAEVKLRIKQIDEGSQGVQRFGGNLRGMIATAGKVSLALGAVATAGKIMWDQLDQGAQLDRTIRQFDALAESVGSSSAALMGDLRVATKGMVSDAELMAATSELINTGLAKTGDQAVRLATAVGTLGLDMGVLNLTLLNDSKMRLDSLKLSAERVEEIQARLKSEGFVGDAFDEAVIIALEEKMSLLEDSTEGAAKSIAILKAAFANSKNELQAWLAEAGEPFLEWLVRVTHANDEVIAADASDKIEDILMASNSRLDAIRRFEKEFGKGVLDPLLSGEMLSIDIDGAKVFAYEIDELNNKITDYGNSLSALNNLSREHVAVSGSAAHATKDYVYSLEELARMGRDAMPEAMGNLNQIFADQQAAIRGTIAGFNAAADPVQRYLQAQQDLADAQGEWVQVTITNSSKIAEVSSALAADLTDDQVKAYRDILNTVDEGSSEWLAAYQALQGDLTQSQRQELVAQLADLQASGDSIASVYTGNSEAAAAAVAAMKEAHQDLIESYRDVAVESMLAQAEMSGDPDALQFALDYAVAIGDMSQAEADMRMEAALTRDEVEKLSEMVATGDYTAEEAAKAFYLLSTGLADTAEEALNATNKAGELDTKLRELNGRNVNINFTAQGLEDLERRLNNFINTVGGGGGPAKSGDKGGEAPTSNTGANALGGHVWGGGMYQVGEFNMPELLQQNGRLFLIPGDQGNVIPSGQMAGAMPGGGLTINIGTLIQRPGENVELFARRTMTLVNERMGRAN